MPDRPGLPRTMLDWVRVFGPGAIIASLTIGTGELIFSTRGGALFGFNILFVFVLISVLKWGLVLATSRHMLLTGVHPYERMLELPGPRGWLPIMLLLMATVCMPIWLSFHSGVLGNLTSWITGTRDRLHGGMDYLWGAAILSATLLLSWVGGYRILERVQTTVVLAMVSCAALTLLLYQPDWLELLRGVVPQPLSYPDWVPGRFPEIARHSVWIETTRYVGVIGGAGFDYLAYTTWLREKRWGVLPARATPAQLRAIAADPAHEVRRWLKAPLIDSAISFGMVVAFSGVFVASGAMFLRPEQAVPDEDNLLNLQARFVTGIHPLLLPLYVFGAFLTMLGTLYGTVEITCSIAEEIVRSLAGRWNDERSRRLKRGVIAWCAPISLGILMWLFVRQTSPAERPLAPSPLAISAAVGSAPAPAEPPRIQKPRLLLAILTPVNLFTGVLACGLICVLSIWMDRRWLPPGLRAPLWLTGLNSVSAVVFLLLGIKGYLDNENRFVVLCGTAGVLAAAMLIAAWASGSAASADTSNRVSTEGAQGS